ncbi:MAG TPA: hypothetical protein PLU69_07205 [Acinetobacter sp.]|nr:hypothetical protein [Acinetobacter sp.]
MMNRPFKWMSPLLSLGVISCLGLTACDNHNTTPDKQVPQAKPSLEENATPVAREDQGVSLTDVAGQPTMPAPAAPRQNLAAPSKLDLEFAGRYHALIPCTDAFAGCINGEKEAEYILNLLPDGSVYWTNTSFGRLGTESTRNISKIEQTCKQVQWVVHKEFNEIMLRCDAANINLYYQINQNQDLVLDRDKIWNSDDGANRQFFHEYPFPEKPYVFEKVK